MFFLYFSRLKSSKISLLDFDSEYDYPAILQTTFPSPYSTTHLSAEKTVTMKSRPRWHSLMNRPRLGTRNYVRNKQVRENDSKNNVLEILVDLNDTL